MPSSHCGRSPQTRSRVGGPHDHCTGRLVCRTGSAPCISTITKLEQTGSGEPLKQSVCWAESGAELAPARTARKAAKDSENLDIVSPGVGKLYARKIGARRHVVPRP